MVSRDLMELGDRSRRTPSQQVGELVGQQAEPLGGVALGDPLDLEIGDDDQRATGENKEEGDHRPDATSERPVQPAG